MNDSWLVCLLITLGLVVGWIIYHEEMHAKPRPCVCVEQPYQPPVESKREWPTGMMKKTSTPSGRE